MISYNVVSKEDFIKKINQYDDLYALYGEYINMLDWCENYTIYCMLSDTPSFIIVFRDENLMVARFMCTEDDLRSHTCNLVSNICKSNNISRIIVNIESGPVMYTALDIDDFKLVPELTWTGFYKDYLAETHDTKCAYEISDVSSDRVNNISLVHSTYGRTGVSHELPTISLYNGKSKARDCKWFIINDENKDIICQCRKYRYGVMTVISSLTTVEYYRKEGYATHLLKEASREVIDGTNVIVAITNCQDAISGLVLSRAGFKPAGTLKSFTISYI